MTDQFRVITVKDMSTFGAACLTPVFDRNLFMQGKTLVTDNKIIKGIFIFKFLGYNYNLTL
jgi:hypothetical protein